MKLSRGAISSIVATLMVNTLSSPPTMTSAIPIESCADQRDCFDITVTSMSSTTCGSDFACEYKVCMKLNFNKPGCNKGVMETVSHTCETPEDECLLDVYRFEGNSTPAFSLENGYKQCQVVPQGGVADFVLKDGDGLCGFYNENIGASSLLCRTFGDPVCLGGGYRECIWNVGVPTECGQNHGGSDGDPHIKLWNSTRYSYHGECDLVLLENKDFADGLGMDIHIRTTHEAFYSYIESAAIRIGTDILEFSGNDFWLNSVQGSDSDLPTTVGGGSFLLNPPTWTKSRKTKSYIVQLNNDDYLLVSKHKHFMSVQVHGNPKDFGSAVGLLGNYYTSEMLARDGMTVLHDPDEFGAEWQVQGDEHKLFHTLREPQHPHATCKPVPEVNKAARRHLRDDAMFVKAAEQACAHKDTHDYEFCVHDVLATKDLGMAEAW